MEMQTETDIRDLIARRLAAPKRFRVVTGYTDGSEKSHDTATLAQAENWAIGERRKLGRDLISRETGATVRVASVAVFEIA